MRHDIIHAHAVITASIAAAMIVMAPRAAVAEMELSAYGGWQTAPHSGVTVNDPVLEPGLFTEIGGIGCVRLKSL